MTSEGYMQQSSEVKMTSNHTESASEKLQTVESHAQVGDADIEIEDVEIDASGETLKRKKKMRSKVWQFFKKVKRPTETPGVFEVLGVCLFCNDEFKADSKKYGTSGLRYHSMRCSSNPSNSQKTILSYIPPDGMNGDDASGTLKNWNFDKEAVRKALAYMVMVDELPFRFVEHAGFQHFMRVACPMFSIPSRWTVARDCYSLYEEEKVKLKSFLKKSVQRVCFTTDTWTSMQRINYLCLTAHFIDNNWKLNKKILNFVPISSHRGEDIGIVIERCLAYWGITNVFTITVDNAASNNNVVAYLKKKLSIRNGCVLQGKYMHMRCIAHIINLIVVDGLRNMKHSISRIRNAVRYVRQSPSRWEKFKECISLEKIDSKSHVSLDVRTRWNSTYLMLESAVKFESAFEKLELLDPCFSIELCSKNKGKCAAADDSEDAFIALLEENEICDEENDGIPNKTDWENARRFVGFLRHFYTLTVRISGSKYVTSNSFFTEISSVLYLLEEWRQDKDKALACMAARMRQKYDKYWGNVKKMNMVIYFAAILDPRLKLEYLKWTFGEIYKAPAGDTQVEAADIELSDFVKTALYEMFSEYMNMNNCVVGRKEGSGTSIMQTDSDKGMDVAEGCSKLYSLYMKHKSKASNEENRTELDIYLNEATENIDTDSEFDILSWWKMHSPRFPILSQMARDILAVPISTVASESAFSTSGRILDAFRSSLTPRVVQALICTQDWIRSCTSQSHMYVEEDMAAIEKLDEDLTKMDMEQMLIE